jgi:hypothetical protein
VAEHHGRPQLQLEALGDIAEELGRLASRVETTSFHPGYSFRSALDRPVDQGTHEHSHLQDGRETTGIAAKGSKKRSTRRSHKRTR